MSDSRLLPGREADRSQQRLFTERFFQVRHRARFPCPFPPLLVVVGGHKNDWVFRLARGELFPEDQGRSFQGALRPVQGALARRQDMVIKKVFRGIEGERMVSERGQ